MGLELVEMVLAVEEEFSVDLPASRLSGVYTVGELFELVLEQSPPEVAASRDAAWTRYVNVLAHDTGIPLARFHPETRFVQDLRLQ